MEKFDFEIENKKKRKLKKGPFYVIGCLLCLIIGSCGGYFLASQKNETVILTHSVYDQIAQIIESGFLDTTESDTSVNERMLAGMVAALGDRYTSYLTVEQANALTTSINGSFIGIGVTFRGFSDGALITEVFDNTPAKKAGLLAGDIITHVEGTTIAGYDSDKIKSVIQGEEGTSVLLRILRNGEIKEVKVLRESVDTAVSYEVRESNGKKFGYIRLTTFGDQIANVVGNGLKIFESEKIDTLVLDLRDNGGGYLNAAYDLLNLFFNEGQTIVRIQYPNGKEETLKAKEGHKYVFKSGYILVNHESASASEVTTGALKENLGYQVVGETTYGKGIVQIQKRLSDSSVLKYTNSKWLTPQGKWINGKGITPDIEVKNTTINNFNFGKIEKNYQYDQVDQNIQYMQVMLKELGYSIDRCDGYFSKGTQNALKAFENKYHLKQDGIYDKSDATILLNVLAYHICQENDDNQYNKVLELIK